MTEPAYQLVRAPRPATPKPALDESQQSVVDRAGGPLLVLAGPGTGKTTTLVEAVVSRADRGVPVEQMLMLTFSRRAAAELRDRVAGRLRRTVREPVARTLHSYAFGVLRMAAMRDGAPTPRLLAAAEQDVIIRELLAHGDPARWPEQLRPALGTLGFADALRDLLMRAVERGLDGPALRALGRDRGRADWVAAADFLAEYAGVTVLRDPGGYDPAELIQGALNALRDDPQLLAAERERRRRIFVDEYQDTDPAQAQLLALVSAGADEVILVGDPDQSIYAFRGADESAIREVDERFGGGRPVPRVALRTCRRSGPALLTATRRVAARLPGVAEHRALTPAPGLPAGRLEVAVFRTAAEEAAHLAGVLRAARLDGTPWSSMAVLVRSTVQTVGTLRRAMTTAGVPVAVRGADIPLAEQPAVTMLLTTLGCVRDPETMTDDIAETLLVGQLGGADSMLIRRLRRVLRQAFGDVDGSLAAAVSDPIGARQLPEHVRWPVVRVARVLEAGARSRHASTEDVLWAMWDASGLGPRWERASLTGGLAAAAADRDLDAIVQLFDEAAKFTDRLPAAPASLFLEHLRAQHIPGDMTSVGQATPEAVSILTAHASKGLEWDLVCVANVQEGSWPDVRRRGTLLGAEELVDAARGLPPVVRASVASQLAEERRLFYVAVTRARNRLVVTAVSGDEEQPSRLLDELDPVDGERPPARLERSVHLPGLVAQLRAVVCAPDPNAVAAVSDAGTDAVSDAERAAAAAELARLAAAGVPGADPDDWWGLAEVSTDAGTADPDRPVRVSPSRLESFLGCELRQVLRDLGVQDDDAVAANFGTLVHDLAAHAPAGQSLEEFERQLQQVWNTLDFGASWFADNERARASTMLERLVGWLRDSRANLELLAIERDFEVAVGEAVLAGRVDRLERDNAGRLVVIDLKTGRSKPKPADLPTLPQLGAYQLAIQQGAFPEAGVQPGGAALVQLGATGDVQQWQPPLDDVDDPEWARRAVEQVARRMRGAQFTAIMNSRCQICDVRACCPLQAEGRQVPQ